MITIKADFNHLDGAGRLILSDLVIHDQTPFETIAASGNRILFVQGEDIVFGRLVKDAIRGWCGEADWDTVPRVDRVGHPLSPRALLPRWRSHAGTDSTGSARRTVPCRPDRSR